MIKSTFKSINNSMFHRLIHIILLLLVNGRLEVYSEIDIIKEIPAHVQSHTSRSSTNGKGRDEHTPSTAYTPYKDHLLQLPINSRNIGTYNDDLMKNFKCISSHGREDVFNTDSKDQTSSYKMKVAQRALLHIWNFLPVLSTSPIAYLSPNFRNFIWYTLITNALGKGGAVSC